MSLSVGIVGLPNVGKSTLFNALLKRQIADVANYPFTTIKPHTGVVAVSDKKLEQLEKLVKPEKTVPATVTFVDIAGLVKGAHKGEGLGNEFLGQIRNVDAVVHVLRKFESKSVAHVMGSVDIERDKKIIKSELREGGIDKPTIEWVNDDKEKFNNLDELIIETYKLLKLITFYTIKGGKELRATAIKKSANIIEAAEKVHTDFAQKFIRAQVIKVDDLIANGGWQTAKSKGRVRTEGRDYMVKDGEVIEFLVGK